MSRPLATAAGLGVAALTAAFFLWPAPAAAPVVEFIEPGAGGEPLTVHVSGSVASPGLVSLPSGSRVADAIVAAGGALPGADLAALNLAAPLVDGQQLVVPQADDGMTAAPADGRVRINTADATALEILPGVGPVLAQRIIAYREINGPFRTVEDLLEVPGIGEGKLAEIRDSVIVP